MSRPELGLSERAKRALISANTQNGNLPQGTPAAVEGELREAGLFGAFGMTIRGRAARGRLLDDALEEL